MGDHAVAERPCVRDKTADGAPVSSNTIEEPVRRRTGGRSARVRSAVLDAALEALAEVDPSEVTISGFTRSMAVYIATALGEALVQRGLS